MKHGIALTLTWVRIIVVALVVLLLLTLLSPVILWDLLWKWVDNEMSRKN